VADEHAAVGVACQRDELGDHAGLADARVAAEEHGLTGRLGTG
jgi:hypothetical protein